MYKTLYIFSILFVLVGCGGKVVSTSSEKNHNTVEVVDYPSASDDYVKPEGWVTVTNKQYGFSVDVPEEIENSVDTGGSLNGGARNGLAVQARKYGNFHMGFAIYEHFTELLPLENPNTELVAKGGDAFKYFVYARSFDDVEDAVIWNKSKHEIPEIDYLSDINNFISVDFSYGTSPDEHLKTTKTIIRSFKKL